jgi:hypothetical protein
MPNDPRVTGEGAAQRRTTIPLIGGGTRRLTHPDTPFHSGFTGSADGQSVPPEGSSTQAVLFHTPSMKERGFMASRCAARSALESGGACPHACDKIANLAARRNRAETDLLSIGRFLFQFKV